MKFLKGEKNISKKYFCWVWVKILNKILVIFIILAKQDQYIYFDIYLSNLLSWNKIKLVLHLYHL